jgi:hypothetical protein
VDKERNELGDCGLRLDEGLTGSYAGARGPLLGNQLRLLPPDHLRSFTRDKVSLCPVSVAAFMESGSIS